MPLPSLDPFMPTIKALHRAAILLAPLNSALKTHKPNAQHLPLEVHPYGLRSSYPKGGSAVLHWGEGKLIYYHPSNYMTELPLAEHSQKSLFEALLNAMSADELKNYIADTEGESFAEKLILKFVGGDVEKAKARLEHYQSEEPLTIDSEVARQYGDVLNKVFTGMARWRARVGGALSPMIVWPEHFDMSTIWFATPEMDEYKSHINIGFAPYTDGHFEKPYLYAYTYPYPQTFTMPFLSEPLKWEYKAYNGILVSYEDIARQEHPEAYVEQICARMFEILKRVAEA
jgi:hypothetical protein